MGTAVPTLPLELSDFQSLVDTIWSPATSYVTLSIMSSPAASEQTSHTADAALAACFFIIKQL